MSYPPSWVAVFWLKANGGFDNNAPRAQVAKLAGMPFRAKSAHYNCLEALPAFAAGVFVAHLGGGDPHLLTQLSVAFIAVRLVYVGLYLADQALLRSVAWTIGLLITCALFLLPVLK
jgi:uncharacterized MAPEG superfamily protein